MDKMIGMRIKQRRKELKITQKQIESLAGISSGNLSGIETGRYLPSSSALIDLSEILECSIDWILKGESSISNSSIIFDNEDSSTERELLEYYRGMSASDQEELLLIAKIKFDKRKATSSNSDQETETA